MCTVRQQSREVCFWTLVSPGHMATTHWALGRAGHPVSPCCSLSCCGYRKITRPPGPQLSWGESHTVLPSLNWSEASFNKMHCFLVLCAPLPWLSWLCVCHNFRVQNLYSCSWRTAALKHKTKQTERIQGSLLHSQGHPAPP